MRSVSLGVWVNTGSRDENHSKTGISHFIEHMIFKGTRSRSAFQIAKELDAVGGLSNAFTGKENTCFHGRVIGKHLTQLANILSDIFLNSKFDNEDMDRERQVILQEISMLEDTPDDNIHVIFNKLFWLDHPIGMSILGTGDTVSTLGKRDILGYMDRFYIPERILVAAAGDVDHEAMVSYFEPLFGQLREGKPNGKRNLPIPNPGVSVHFKDLEQVHICVGGEAPSQRSEDRFACAIFNTIIGGNMSSRLFQEIRENRGLAYSVYSFVSSYIDTGLFGVYVGTDPKSVNPVLATIQTEIRKIQKGELSESDLSEAKEHMIGGIYLASESTDNRMMRNAKNEFVFERYVGYEELVSILQRVKVEDVVEIANKVFQKGRVALATLGPLKEEDIDRSCLQFDQASP
jgi:predicted Zn-dependent peptidase